MKTVAFIFEKRRIAMPQVEWAAREYIDPRVHQVLLIYVVDEKLFCLNDPRVLASSLRIIESDEVVRRRLAKEYLERVREALVVEFSERLVVTKLIVCGSERNQLGQVLATLCPAVVVLGPDTAADGFAAIFCESVEDFVVKQLCIPVVRVPEYKKR